MSTQSIVERILSDAEKEAEAIVNAAEKNAAAILAEASSRAEIARRAVEAESKVRAESILEKKSADARLECAKILLKEKRKVLDAVYALALQRLLALDKETCIRLYETLLTEYAETGDTVCFADSFKYEKEVSILPIVEQKGLNISAERLAIAGGMRLIGKVSDKDLSFEALLATDKENFQAELAKSLFK